MILNSKSFNHAEKRKAYFFYLLLSLVLATFLALPRLSIPILIAHIIYLIISPAVPMLQKLGVNRSIANIIVFALFIFSTAYPFTRIVPIISEESDNIQYYLPKLENYLRDQSLTIQTELKERVGYTLEDDYLPEMIDLARSKLTVFILALPNYIGNLLEWVFLIPLIIFFLLKDGRRFKRNILSLAPNNVFERFYYLTHKFNKKLGDYIFAKFIEGLIVGIIIWIGLLFIGVRFSLILALVAALTNIIPYVGPIIGFVPALIFSLAEYGTGTTTMAIITLYLIANAIDMALVFPILVSKVVDLHPMLVVISVIVGGQWLGIIGMVISIPLAAAFKLIFEEVYQEFYERT
jgi:putative permease